jgi:F0F1-type ATP synthase assembly protein I
VSGPDDRRPGQNHPPEPPRASAGWAVTSYLIGGMACYGGIGWLIGRWTGIEALFPVGMLVGLALAIALIIFRFARPGSR